MFSNPVLFSGVCSPQGLLCVQVILFSSDLSIQPVCYAFSVPIFYSKIVLLPLHPIVGMSSCSLHLLFGRVFFRYFGLFYFVSHCLAISSLSFPQCLLIYLFKLYFLTYLLLLVFSPQHILACFFFLGIFACCCNFFYLSFLPNFCSGSIGEH